MTALVAAIFTASLFGSLHCAGMCGAFVLFAIGAGDPQVTSRRSRLMAVYHLGRLITYVMLGALAGGIGSAVDFAGNLAGVQRAATIGAGALIIGFGSVTLLRLSGAKIPALRIPSALQRIVTAGHRTAMQRSPMVRALATGLLTTLLPCGWLYAFVITAAGTAHPAMGALVMATFWTGTLPALTLFAAGIQRVSAPLARRLPVITAAAVVGVGIYTIAARAHIPLPVAKSGQPKTTDLVEHVKSIDQSTLPCCAATQEAP
ncbi:MAG: sulfite exporter TauE/SafE family protein [Phycisphaerae bacterium]